MIWFRQFSWDGQTPRHQASMQHHRRVTQIVRREWWAVQLSGIDNWQLLCCDALPEIVLEC